MIRTSFVLILMVAIPIMLAIKGTSGFKEGVNMIEGIFQISMLLDIGLGIVIASLLMVVFDLRSRIKKLEDKE